MISGIVIALGGLFGLGVYYLLFGNLLSEATVAGLRIKGGLNSAQKEKLNSHFQFYQQLPPKSKALFEYRVANFIRMKEFVPRNMTHVTEEMQVLIAASAIQLTFGYPKVFLSYFRYVIVFPDQFFSNSGQRYHKGEVNPKAKAIVLSWKHFVEGYSKSDGVNLGLHEMAHALQLENIVMNDEYDFLDSEAIKHWQALASAEIVRIQNDAASFFREYGASNHAEFFAVAVENFFERPVAFHDYQPALYSALARLLKQDPMLLSHK
ncbi:zinc-dependent peptidase [Marinoscillum sp.]|uniref:zinc-dependent peptidase n=1 Tax=Marinoscillum sp. TaxID=2024838 RepID=UPI003BAC79AC